MAWSLGPLVTVWMAGSMIHYTILPGCLTKSSFSVLIFSLLQIIVTGAISFSSQSANSQSSLRYLLAQPNVIVAAIAFAVAVGLTNTGVAFGSVSGTRLIKSLEPVLVACVQFVVHRQASAKGSQDPAWLFLLVAAIAVMLGSSSVYMTFYASGAALVSTLGIVLRNVFIKKELETGSVCRMPSEIQTAVNGIACGIFAVLTCVRIVFGDSVRADIAAFITRLPSIALACVTFAAFQIAAVLVLDCVSATRQSAIKSVHSSGVTLWTLLIQRSQQHAGLMIEEILPTVVWCATVVAIAVDARVSSHFGRHTGLHSDAFATTAGKGGVQALRIHKEGAWRILLGVCWAVLMYQSARGATEQKNQ